MVAEPSRVDLETWALWAALRTVPQPEDVAEHRKAVGTAAERLSFIYEKQRLTKAGYSSLASRIRWVARESPAYGFDILSFCGANSLGRIPETQLAIEVKGQSLVARPNFSFFLTRHEWRTANMLGANDYIFHFWHGVNASAPENAAHTTPVTVSPSLVERHVPLSPTCASKCDWESTFVSLDISGTAE
jgi:hypothetical protein